VVCEIARNGDPAWESRISLIVLANLPIRWGHGWARKMTPLDPILRSEIKAVGFIGSGVIVARDFA